MPPKVKTTKCPICKGTGELENPKHTDQDAMKFVVARSLNDHGYSYRQIAKYMGVAHASVQHYLGKR